MSRLTNLPISLERSLRQSSLLKVISGLDNFEKTKVEKVAKASSIGGANLLDVACDPDLVRLAIKSSELPICVSSVDPHSFVPAVQAGATMIEIGNFDSFYKKGRYFDQKEVLALTEQSRSLLPDVVLSVTVPHTLPLDVQEQLAINLVERGADIIQTEGGTSAIPDTAGSLGLIQKAAPTLAAAHVISKAIAKSNSFVPIICASGLSSVTIPMAFAVGASGVGVGSAVNKLSTEIEMIAAVRALKESTLQTTIRA